MPCSPCRVVIACRLRLIPPRTEHDSNPHDGAPAFRQLIHSPNGEPLGRALCHDALTVWFAHTGSNRDGLITNDEFEADSTAQFTRLDRDDDGVITADELQEIRRPFLIEPQNKDLSPSPEGNIDSNHADLPDAGAAPNSWFRHHSVGRGEDPVMTADSNLDFKVSRAEFRTRAKEVFARLDRDKNQALAQEEVTASCLPPSPSR
ncbi:hypothetical protein [Magnetospirillum sulfuroxidans]|uniref:EF-hand domain-containing protein n=1 Tax=Magnetospirillum sulfuroxidans TaxID=611300 RepID=A0ABS5IA70_9PROT|nr:hypothetical protein [Magnetospirillum sulfuroxidans]MBR9971331.1 hypothetical protein [Magnetospirillum sulfuroxidans]